METAVESGLRAKPWTTHLKNLAFGIGALGTVAFATPAQAVATYSAFTDVQISATIDGGDPGSIIALATGTNFVLDAVANGVGFSQASTNAGGVAVDLAAGPFQLTATASGNAGPGLGDAQSQSLNDVVLTLLNAGTTAATITLTFTWDQIVDATTTLLGETASATSDLLFTDSLAAVLLDSVINASSFDGLNASDAASGSLTFVYVLDPNDQLGITGVVGTGLADAFGNAFAVPIPEPASTALLLIGLAGLAFARRRSLKF